MSDSRPSNPAPTPDPTSGDSSDSINSIDREIAHHIDTLTDAYIAQGLPPEEARRRALIEFGGREQVRQTVREVHISAFAESVAFHLKAALRFLRKSPSFSLAVILTLALGIGANSAVFSAIDAVVLRPLPFPDGNQLVALYQHDIKGRDANRFVAPVRLEDWNRLTSKFQSISGYYLDDLSETSGPLPEKVTEVLVAPRFLETLGISPALGREFTPAEERWGGGRMPSSSATPSGSDASTVTPMRSGKKSTSAAGAAILSLSLASCPPPSSFPRATSTFGLPALPTHPSHNAATRHGSP